MLSARNISAASTRARCATGSGGRTLWRYCSLRWLSQPLPNSSRSRTLTLLAALAIAVSGSIGVYHAGVEAKIFQGFTTCTALAKTGSTADMLKQITHAPLVRCDEVQFRFLGISMAGWNAILSLGGAALILILSLRAKRA